jgi:uncharacterized protein YidB (DUF937 family)
MSMLDDLLKGAMGALSQGQGGGAGSPDALMGMVGSLLQQQGGVAGLVGALEKGGLGDVAQSWVGKGANMPVSADALTQALGSDSIGKIASQLGIDSGAASGLLSQVLPGLVDKMTPDGALPQGGGQDAGDLLQAGLKAFLSGR